MRIEMMRSDARAVSGALLVNRIGERLRRSRRAPLLALLVFAIGTTRTLAAHAAVFDVPCDPFALRSVMATVNSNRAADSLSLAPSCVYLLTETMSIASDGGQPVQIDGRGATLSGDSRRGVMIVDPGATLRLSHATVTLGAADLGAGS
jgi:hypothetical protein